MKIMTNTGIRDATVDEIQRYDDIAASDDAISLYRGVALTTALNQYKESILNPSREDNVATSLAFKIFHVGVKAKYYSGKAPTTTTEQIFERVEDESDEVFDRLRLELQKLLDSPSDAESQFLKQNETFSQKLSTLSFANLRNAHPGKRILIRDYYIGILHQFEKRNPHSFSPLVSTSISEATARAFGLKFCSDCLLFEYFVPRNQASIFTIGPFQLTNPTTVRLLEEYNLPQICHPPFEGEAEYSVRRALLPHFIRAITFASRVNPTGAAKILNPDFARFDWQLTDVIQNGLRVDHSNFHEIRHTTSFYRYGQYANGVFTEGN